MKVGTDGVLLGAQAPLGQTRRVLDIGSGSGLIALMLAQRSGDEVTIDAVELDEAAAGGARKRGGIAVAAADPRACAGYSPLCAAACR